MLQWLRYVAIVSVKQTRELRKQIFSCSSVVFAFSYPNWAFNYPNWAFNYPLLTVVVQYHGKLNNLHSLRLGSC